MEMSQKLDNRGERFAREYILDFNGTRAAIAAGYSKRTAYAAASRLLKSAKVKALLAQLTEKKMEQLDVSAERILRELALIGFSNMLDYLTPGPDGSLALDFSKLTREQAAAIQEVREDRTGGRGDGERKLIMRTTFKLADKTKALELLGKYQKLFTEKIQHVFPEQPVDLSRLTNEELAIVERILESADITDEGVDEGSEGKG